MTNLDVKTIIISRGRADTITSHAVFPHAELWCPQSQIDQYEKLGLKTVAVPDSIVGLGPVRNHVLDNCESRVVVMVDDDVEKMWCNVGLHGREELAAEALVENLALMAADLGVSCFGYAQAWDVRKYNASKPFSFSGWTGGVIGVVGRKHRFLSSKFKVDIDFCLTCLLHDRIILIDNRYAFVQKRRSNVGGNSEFRSKEGYERDTEYIRKKWGKHLQYKVSDSGEITSVRVER
jgi:hypothetical protein